MDRKQISGCLELRGKAAEGGRRMSGNVHRLLSGVKTVF